MTPYEKMEQLIDQYGVADVLLMISDIASYKSEHIASSYQDFSLEHKWMKAASVIRRAVKDLPKVPGIK